MEDRSEETAVVKHADDVERKEVAAGTATATQVLLGPEDGALAPGPKPVLRAASC